MEYQCRDVTRGPIFEGGALLMPGNHAKKYRSILNLRIKHYESMNSGSSRKKCVTRFYLLKYVTSYLAPYKGPILYEKLGRLTLGDGAT